MNRLLTRRFPILPGAVLFTLLLGGCANLWLSHAPTFFKSAEIEAAGESPNAPGADEWFHAQRAYPQADVPPGALDNAREQMLLEETRLQALSERAGEPAFDVTQNNLPWVPLGPQPIANGQLDGGVVRPASGRVMSLALDPNYDGVNNQTIYAGAAHGGLWRTRDNGRTWQTLMDDQPTQAVGAITIDPSNSNTIYVGTGTASRSISSYYGEGLFKSTDGGATWRQISGPLSNRAPLRPAFLQTSMPRVALDPANPATLFVCTLGGSITSASGSAGGAPIGQRGVWKSTDRGETWRNSDPTGGTGGISATDLVIDPRNSNVVIAAMLSNGLYRSTGAGEPGTWTKLTNNLPTTGFGRIALATGPPLPPSSNTTFYAAFANSAAPLVSIFRSTDNGDSWQALTTPPELGQPFHNLVLVADTTDPNLLYFGEVQLFRSRDGGQSWQRITFGDGSGGIHVDQHAIALNPRNRNQIVIGNDGGVWRSDNALANTMRWENLNDGLNITQFQGLAIHPTSNFLIGGTQDNGTMVYENSLAWRRVAGGDGGASIIDQSNPTTVYHNFQSSTGSLGPRVSFNSGASWTDIGCRGCTATIGRLHPSDRVTFYAPMAQHIGFTTQPNGNVIYFGTNRLYRSANNGSTWTGLGPSADGFGQDMTTGSGAVSAIAAYPRLDTTITPPGEIVWVGTSTGLIRVATDAGKLADATFTNVTKAPLPNRFVSGIVPDATNPQRAVAVYSGFDANTPATPGHVFITEDRGATWRNISGNLPDIPVSSVVLEPTSPEIIYLGTDLGVFRTLDGGATWRRFGTGIPNTSVFILRYHAASRSLVAATHGRGAFRLALPAPIVSVSAASYDRNALALEGIAAAFGERLATRTESARTIPLPTQLAGTRVVLTDANGATRDAPLFFVSPLQVNYQIPPNLAPGAFTVTSTSGDGTMTFGAERARAIAPSVFTFNANGRGVPAGFAVSVRNNVQTNVPIARHDGTQFVPTPIDLGDASTQVVLVLYGSGWRKRAALSDVRVTLAGVDAPVAYAGEAPGFVGLDQLNCNISRSLLGRGEIDALVRVGTATANTTRINIR
jgi:uncharacterized protein (TIGR03437 family)